MSTGGEGGPPWRRFILLPLKNCAAGAKIFWVLGQKSGKKGVLGRFSSSFPNFPDFRGLFWKFAPQARKFLPPPNWKFPVLRYDSKDKKECKGDYIATQTGRGRTKSNKRICDLGRFSLSDTLAEAEEKNVVSHWENSEGNIVNVLFRPNNDGNVGDGFLGLVCATDCEGDAERTGDTPTVQAIFDLINLRIPPFFFFFFA